MAGKREREKERDCERGREAREDGGEGGERGIRRQKEEVRVRELEESAGDTSTGGCGGTNCFKVQPAVTADKGACVSPGW